MAAATGTDYRQEHMGLPQSGVRVELYMYVHWAPLFRYMYPAAHGMPFRAVYQVHVRVHLSSTTLHCTDDIIHVDDACAYEVFRIRTGTCILEYSQYIDLCRYEHMRVESHYACTFT